MLYLYIVKNDALSFAEFEKGIVRLNDDALIIQSLPESNVSIFFQMDVQHLKRKRMH